MEIFESKDKQIVPFLLVQSGIKFLGTRLNGTILYFQFSPLKKCQDLTNDFMTRRAPPVDPKTLLDAVDSFRDRIFEIKEKNKNDKEKY